MTSMELVFPNIPEEDETDEVTFTVRRKELKRIYTVFLRIATNSSSVALANIFDTDLSRTDVHLYAEFFNKALTSEEYKKYWRKKG